MNKPPSQKVSVSAELIERYSKITSGTLTTELFRRGLRQCFLVGLRPMNPDAARFAGEAFTMRMIPAREDVDTYATLTPHANPNNLQWEAVENIGKDQVLVIDSRNDPRAASAGAMLPTRMMIRAPPASSRMALSATVKSSLGCRFRPMRAKWSPRPGCRFTTLPICRSRSAAPTWRSIPATSS
jgi:hypothetical protein